ncbi:NACHT domain-containing protein, partial [Streptomyces sp. NPDC005526]|uniref:NACHT domain-containing protein n=1 Tax=Streptomyces sp. NPDC005526 TaxID=3156885 RepID=UPI0033B75117
MDSLAPHGYTPLLCPSAPLLTARRIGHLVEDALAGSSPGDALIVHLLSHGVSRNRSVQIVGSDGNFGSRTDVNSWLSDAMDREPAHDDRDRACGRSVTLFLVDVCGAGQAARLAWLSDMDDERRQAWVLAGCQPDRPAFNGWFTQAMTTVLERAHAQEFDIHPSQRFIPLPLIAQNIRKETKRLCRDGYVQLVVGTPVDLAAEVDLPFFPNPGYSHDAAKQHHTLNMLNPGLADFCESVDELVDPWHFCERALGRGPDRRTAVGCFRGRQRELATLTSWLDGESSGALRVVTGSPGSGKSALLGMLVCSAHPELHEATQHVWFHRRDELPSVHPCLVALHLRDQSIGAILDSVARQTGLSGAAEDWSGEAIADALTRSPEPVVVVVDALDEAEDPGRVVSGLLDPLLDRKRPDGAPCCRLLIATRPWDQFEPLLSRARHAGGLVDLDDVRSDELENALRSYVIDLLNGNNEYRQLSHRRLRDSIAGSVAGRLASRHAEQRPQWGEFLVAGLYANSLVQQGGITAEGAADQTPAAAAAGVPGTLPEVLDLDLRRQTSPWVRPILCALAFARGQGMPRTAIRAVAPLFADPWLDPPTQDEVRDALEEARFYLRRDMDVDGSIVYRLFHQALIDHLRSASTLPGRREEASRMKERLVLDRLLDLVGRAEDGGLYWEEAPPYLLRHMSEHAAACGLLNTLAQDTEFLVHSDPASVGAHLTGTEPEERSVAAVYRASLSCHQHLDARARRSVLAIDASRYQMPELARRLSRPPRQQALAWQPRWVTGAPWELSPCESLMGCTEQVRSVSCGTVDGRPVVVSAGTREGVSVWDLETGREQARLVGHRGPVNAAACCEVNGRAAVVTAGSDRSLRLWDLATGEHVSTLTADAGPVTSLACVTVDGSPVAVASGREGLVRAWDVTAATEKASLPGHQGPAWAATGIEEAGALVATGGYDGSVRIWDLAQGAECAQLPRHESGVLAVAHLASSREESWLLTGGSDGTVRVFDLAARSQRLSFDCRTDSVLAIDCVRLTGQDDGRELCLGVVGGSDGVLSVWDLAAGEKRFDLIGHRGAVNAVGITWLHGRPLLISGGDDGSCRVWDLATGAERGLLGVEGRYAA